MDAAHGRKVKVAGEEAGYLSDESDFYGDDATKQELEARVASFNVLQWWRNKIPTLTEIANADMATAIAVKAVQLYNPYEGLFWGRQLTETVEEFTKRLPPASTTSHQAAWIRIANPYWHSPAIAKSESSQHDVNTELEGPPDEESELPRFLALAGKLLEQLTDITHDIEKEKAGKAKATITKAINIERDMIVNKILDAAVGLHCASGKWMLFCSPGEVNAVWSVIARATANNELGIAAKVAPDPDDGERRKLRLMCIYTKDFTDMKDIYRVVSKLKDLGVVDHTKTIYYKCDAYTYLGLDSSNPYGIKASLYNSKDVLAKGPNQSEGKKVDGYFYRKNDEGDWRPLERE